MMKKFLIATIAVATLAGAGAASAQPYGGPGGDRGGRGGYDSGYGGYGGRYDSRDLNRRQHEIRVRVDMGARSGRLTYREAQSLRAEIQQINRLERQFRATGGLNGREFAILDQRLDNLERRLHHAMRDDDRRGGGPRRY